MKADQYCSNDVEGQYVQYSGRGYYDIAHLNPDPFPPQFFAGFLQQNWVQAAVGSPINFTESTNGVYYGFSAVGDYPRSDVRGYLQDLAYILDSGIKVALVYGDRDYACNWIGGEEVSLAVNYSKSTEFRNAGYTPIHTNSSYVGGQVRQYGNFSFSRVYESGHEVPAYQPETAYRIFHRALNNLDIATGGVSTAKNATYATEGPSNTFHIKNTVPEAPAPTCYIQELLETCTNDQISAVQNGTVLIHYWIVIDANTTHLFPGLGGTNGTSN